MDEVVFPARVLVGVDARRTSDVDIDELVRYVRRFGPGATIDIVIASPIALAASIDHGDPLYPMMELDRFADLHDRARQDNELADLLVAVVRDAGLAVSATCSSRALVDGVVARHCEARRFDLVCLVGTRRSWIDRFQLSAARRVERRTGLPVVVLEPGFAKRSI